MADFEIAYKLTAINEGGYANDKDDKGGETWCGIARNSHPKWEGWAVIDRLKSERDFPTCLSYNTELPALRKKFYRVNFWNVVRGDDIKAQYIANQIYDDAVNCGCSSAINKAQRVVGISETGKMDDLTIRKINNG